MIFIARSTLSRHVTTWVIKNYTIPTKKTYTAKTEQRVGSVVGGGEEKLPHGAI